MTNRDFYTAISAAETLPTELRDKAAELLSKLDTTNEKRRSAESKEKKEAADRRDRVRLFFETNPHEVCTRDAIAAQLSITPGQASAACKSLIEVGYLQKSEVKTKGHAPKVAYSKA